MVLGGAEGGETTKGKNRGKMTRGKTTTGETSWGRNVLLPSELLTQRIVHQ